MPSLLNFTNSGPVVGPAVVEAVSDPGARRLRRRSLARRTDPDGHRRDRLRREATSTSSPTPTPTSPRSAYEALSARTPTTSARADRSVAASRCRRRTEEGAPCPPSTSTASAPATRSIGAGPAAADVLARAASTPAWRTGARVGRLPPAQPGRAPVSATTPASSSTGASPGSPAAGSNGSPGRSTSPRRSGLLDHLGVERAHLMGGCVGCSTVAALAVAHPDRVRSMVLFSPAGGVRYRHEPARAVRAAPRLRRSSTACGAVVDLARSSDGRASARTPGSVRGRRRCAATTRLRPGVRRPRPGRYVRPS